MKVAVQVDKFKNSNWKKKVDSIKDSPEYKKRIEEFKKANKEMQIRLEEFRNSDEFKRSIEEAKDAMEEAKKEMLENKELWKEQAKAAKEAGEKAREMIKKMKEDRKFDSLKKYKGDKYYGENVYIRYSDHKDSKVKIRKYLKVKVPKKATFDLNVRHGELKVPNSNTKMSANISYGNFIAGNINGEKNELEISNSPVNIQTISSGNITLKNVPNASFGTFSNTNLFANSSDVFIDELGNDVTLSQRFGNLEVRKITSDFNLLNLILDYAKADLNFSNATYVYQINSKNSTFHLLDKLTEVKNKTKDGVKFIEGYLHNSSSQNKLLITGVFSTVILN